MKSWTYEKAGVPHLKGEPSYNRAIVRLIASTKIPGVTGNPTGFSSIFDLKMAGVRDPLLVSSTDGVGTKLEIARLLGRHDTIGIDLVAMCVNDIITTGARPLFFLDYYATGKFDPVTTAEVLKGITRGCRITGCALTGGETAVMPGFYSAALKHGAPQYDLAGFSVGVVERKKLITGSAIRPGDVILGLASSGVHSNGYSLIRKVFSETELRGPLGRKFLTPTRIYVKPVLEILRRAPLSGIVNITGGGFIDNIPRVIPDGLTAVILKGRWPVPDLFRLIGRRGNISEFEMMRTFNMGVGMVLILRASDRKAVERRLSQMKWPSWEVGQVVRSKSGGSKLSVLDGGTELMP